MKIQILASAKRDLIGGYQFYEKQSEGLGHYFLDSLFSDFDFSAIIGSRNLVVGFLLPLAFLVTILAENSLSYLSVQKSALNG